MKKRERFNLARHKYSKELLIKIYDRKKSFKQMSIDSGIKYNLLKKLLIEYEITPIKINKKHLHITKDYLLELYNELNLNQIISKLKISFYTLSNLLKYYNIDKKYEMYNLNNDFFTEETKETFYVAGWIAADGSVGDRTVTINLKESDSSHLEKIKKIIDYDGPLLYNKGIHPQWVLSINSKKMIDDLLKFGITEAKSLIYKMPEWILNHKYINYFLLGYFEGDGGFHIRPSGEPQISFRGTKDHLLQIHNIFLENNIITYKNKSATFDGGICKISYGGKPLCIKIYEFLHKDFNIELSRKYDLYLKLKDDYKIIENINYLRKERNKNIIFDKLKNIHINDLVKKYNLDKTTIYKIIKDNK